MNVTFEILTNGRVWHPYAPYTETALWPEIIQLAWITSNEHGIVTNSQVVTMQRKDIQILEMQYLKNAGLDVPAALMDSYSPQKALIEFCQQVNQASQLVCYHAPHKMAILLADLVRHSLFGYYEQKACIDMREIGKGFCQLPGYYGYQYPSLKALYNTVMGGMKPPVITKSPTLERVHMIFACYTKLKEQGFILSYQS